MQPNSKPQLEPLSFLEGEELLRPLFQAVDQHQRDIGMILWCMDPSPAELVKLAEEFGYAAETLRTATRIRNMPDGLPFGVHAEFARITDEDERMTMLDSRPVGEWTIYAAKAAVDDLEQGSSGGP